MAALTNLETPTTQTAGQFLPDGSLLEVVMDPADPSKLALLHWNGEFGEVAARFNFCGKTYVPPAVDSVMAQAIHFPSYNAHSQSTRELFQKLVGLIGASCGLPDQTLKLIAYWILSTWVADVLPMAPTLLISGSSPSEVSRF